MNYQVPVSRVWRFFRSMNGKPNFDFKYPIKAQTNLSLCGDSEIANHFAEQYSDTFNRYPTIVDSKRKSTEIRIALQLDFDADINSELKLVRGYNFLLPCKLYWWDSATTHPPA